MTTKPAPLTEARLPEGMVVTVATETNIRHVQRVGAERTACGKLLVNSRTRPREPRDCSHCARIVHKNAGVLVRHSAEYIVWRNMLERCKVPSDKSYKDYGARGITVCRAWEESFGNFIRDMGARPSPAHSLERRDNDGSYEPGNCYWATKIEQARNTKRTRWLEWKGERRSLAEWAERVEIDAGVIRLRLESGWSVDDALTIPIGATRGLRAS